MMTIESIYLYIMVAAAFSLLITGLILAFVKTPSDGRAVKYRKAKRTLTGAVILLGVFNLLQVGYDNHGTVSFLGPCLALAVSYLQAMLFTMAIMVLIRPEQVTWRNIVIQMGAIVAVEALLVGGFCLLGEHTFLYVYEFCIIIYLLQLGFYTRWFLKGRQVFLQQVSQYYEEDEIERGLRWIFVIFWFALAVGLLSLLMVFNNRMVDLCLTVALAIFYALFAASFINYGLSAPIILPAIYQNLERPRAAKAQQDENLTKLEVWIKNKGYLNNDQAVKDIAMQMEMTTDQLHQYFHDVVGEEFRTWRVRRRIDEAKLLMKQHPGLTTTEIAKMCGFNDRSFFYQQFRRFGGTSVTDYRRSL